MAFDTIAKMSSHALPLLEPNALLFAIVSALLLSLTSCATLMLRKSRLRPRVKAAITGAPILIALLLWSVWYLDLVPHSLDPLEHFVFKLRLEWLLHYDTESLLQIGPIAGELKRHGIDYCFDGSCISRSFKDRLTFNMSFKNGTYMLFDDPASWIVPLAVLLQQRHETGDIQPLYILVRDGSTLFCHSVVRLFHQLSAMSVTEAVSRMEPSAFAAIVLILGVLLVGIALGAVILIYVLKLSYRISHMDRQTHETPMKTLEPTVNATATDESAGATGTRLTIAEQQMATLTEHMTAIAKQASNLTTKLDNVATDLRSDLRADFRNDLGELKNDIITSLTASDQATDDTIATLATSETAHIIAHFDGAIGPLNTSIENLSTKVEISANDILEKLESRPSTRVLQEMYDDVMKAFADLPDNEVRLKELQTTCRRIAGLFSILQSRVDSLPTAEKITELIRDIPTVEQIKNLLDERFDTIATAAKLRDVEQNFAQTIGQVQQVITQSVFQTERNLTEHIKTRASTTAISTLATADSIRALERRSDKLASATQLKELGEKICGGMEYLNDGAEAGRRALAALDTKLDTDLNDIKSGINNPVGSVHENSDGRVSTFAKANPALVVSLPEIPSSSADACAHSDHGEVVGDSKLVNESSDATSVMVSSSASLSLSAETVSTTSDPATKAADAVPCSPTLEPSSTSTSSVGSTNDGSSSPSPEPQIATAEIDLDSSPPAAPESGSTTATQIAAETTKDVKSSPAILEITLAIPATKLATTSNDIVETESSPGASKPSPVPSKPAPESRTTAKCPITGHLPSLSASMWNNQDSDELATAVVNPAPSFGPDKREKESSQVFSSPPQTASKPKCSRATPTPELPMTPAALPLAPNKAVTEHALRPAPPDSAPTISPATPSTPATSTPETMTPADKFREGSMWGNSSGGMNKAIGPAKASSAVLSGNSPRPGQFIGASENIVTASTLPPIPDHATLSETFTITSAVRNGKDAQVSPLRVYEVPGKLSKVEIWNFKGRPSHEFLLLHSATIYSTPGDRVVLRLPKRCTRYEGESWVFQMPYERSAREMNDALRFAQYGELADFKNKKNWGPTHTEQDDKQSRSIAASRVAWVWSAHAAKVLSLARPWSFSTDIALALLCVPVSSEVFRILNTELRQNPGTSGGPKGRALICGGMTWFGRCYAAEWHGSELGMEVLARMYGLR